MEVVTPSSLKWERTLEPVADLGGISTNIFVQSPKLLKYKKMN